MPASVSLTSTSTNIQHSSLSFLFILPPTICFLHLILEIHPQGYVLKLFTYYLFTLCLPKSSAYSALVPVLQVIHFSIQTPKIFGFLFIKTVFKFSHSLYISTSFRLKSMEDYSNDFFFFCKV